MGITITAVGGYDEVGRNMTAIKIDDDVIICDMGIHLENYIAIVEEEDLKNKISAEDLMRVGAIPNTTKIEDWKNKVRAIIPTHAHLDHVGAIPFISNDYKADIICTPFTAAVINSIVKNDKIKLKNKVKMINLNSVYKINDNITAEFIGMTHSTPQTAMVALHTKYGIIVYANDFKFDNYPTLGLKPNIKRLKELGKTGKVLCLICDSTYAYDARKMPSESVAKQMLKDVMLGTDSQGKGVIITTFSSHLARLNSIIDYGKRMNRKILLLGRSLARYVEAGEEVGIINFTKEVELVRYKKQIKKRLSQVMREGKGKYLLVVTGHQGEPGSTLSTMVKEDLGFKFEEGDHVIFSCTVIPSPSNKRNRDNLDKELIAKKVRLFKDIHISGHAAREDLRDLISYLKPKHIIPAHGDIKMTSALYELGLEMGYKEKYLHLLKDGARIEIN